MPANPGRWFRLPKSPLKRLDLKLPAYAVLLDQLVAGSATFEALHNALNQEFGSVAIRSVRRYIADLRLLGIAVTYDPRSMTYGLPAGYVHHRLTPGELLDRLIESEECA